MRLRSAMKMLLHPSMNSGDMATPWVQLSNVPMILMSEAIPIHRTGTRLIHELSTSFASFASAVVNCSRRLVRTSRRALTCSRGTASLAEAAAASRTALSSDSLSFAAATRRSLACFMSASLVRSVPSRNFANLLEAARRSFRRVRNVTICSNSRRWLVPGAMPVERTLSSGGMRMPGELMKGLIVPSAAWGGIVEGEEADAVVAFAAAGAGAVVEEDASASASASASAGADERRAAAAASTRFLNLDSASCTGVMASSPPALAEARILLKLSTPTGSIPRRRLLPPADTERPVATRALEDNEVASFRTRRDPEGGGTHFSDARRGAAARDAGAYAADKMDAEMEAVAMLPLLRVSCVLRYQSGSDADYSACLVSLGRWVESMRGRKTR
mmetsp:Transcript_3187/g.7388  ORF Transcript_3187/g.7388 Transcript_3187/m.7388 type:complete len:389 (+) Transcript_3187:2406-3572(+)